MQQLPLSGLKKEENAKGQRANGKGGKALRNGLVECGADASASASASAGASTDMKNNHGGENVDTESMLHKMHHDPMCR